MTLSFHHVPVLRDEVLSVFAARRGAVRLVDGTAGGGGHSAALLELLPQAELLALDVDPAAVAAAGARLAGFGARARVVHSSYTRMEEQAAALGWDRVDGVLLDLGVSSHQLDEAERGFSFQSDGPLDMRMDPSRGETAAELLLRLDEKALADVLFQHGDERRSRPIARAIKAHLAEEPLERTAALAALVARVIPRRKKGASHPATRTFQALRIAVNSELDRVAAGLEAALRLLAPGGRLAVITFHSGEDRLVKRFLRKEEKGCVCPPDFPVCRCGQVPRLRAVGARRGQTASPAELSGNPRARSARLRVSERLGRAA